MKKKLSLIGLSLVLITLVYQGTMAVIQESTNIDTKMSAAKLGVSIVQNNEIGKEAKKGVTFENILPGANIAHDLKVENTKDKDVYVRVTLTKYWEDENKKKLVNADAKWIELLTGEGNWMMVEAGNTNDEMMYFYYTKPVKAKEITTSFLKEIKCSTALKDQSYANYQMKIEVEVEAIQTVGAKDAILSEWGMEVEIDENQQITSIIE